MQLSTPSPRRSVRILGIAIAVALSVGTAFAVWSAQSPRLVMRTVAAQAQPLSDFKAVIASRIDDGEPASFAIEHAYGKPFSFARKEAGMSLDVEATVRSAGVGRYDIAAIVKREGKVVATPRLIAEAGKSAVVRIGDVSASNGFRGVEVDFMVRPSAGAAAAPEALPRMSSLVSTGMAPAAPQAIGRETSLAPLPGMEEAPLPPLPGMEEGLLPPLPEMQTAPLPPLPAMSNAPIKPLPQLAARSHSKHEPPPAPPAPPTPPEPPSAMAPPPPPAPPTPPEPPTAPAPPAAPSMPTSARAMKAVSLVSIPSLTFLAPQPSGTNDGC